MIWKLQKKTLLPLQIFGYGITLCIGITIILTTLNIYNDIHPVLQEETDMFGLNAVVISKETSYLETIKGGVNVKMGNSADKSPAFFDKGDIKEFKKQEFVEKIDYFNRAQFKSTTYIPVVNLDLFNIPFESVPSDYLEVEKEDWQWEEGDKLIPLIISKQYAKSLIDATISEPWIPLLSYASLKAETGEIQIKSANENKITEDFTCKIVGFSDNINSILVPNKFLLWANDKFGNRKDPLPSKLLVKLNDPSNPKIIEYLEKNNYEINKKELEFTKLINIFRIAFIFIFFIAIIIIILSIAFILLSINLIFQKNKGVLINLYFLGYQIKQISYYYKLLISIVTLFSIAISLIITLIVRKLYSENLVTYFDLQISNAFIYINVLILSVTLLLLINLLIDRKIKKIILS